MLAAGSWVFLTKVCLLFFFFSLKLFTDKKYSSYCDLASWKVWLIINIIIYAFVCGSSKSPRHILGLISLTCCSGSCADLVTVSGDGSVLRWTRWGWHPVFGKHPSCPHMHSTDYGKGCQHSPPCRLCRCSALLQRSFCEDLRVSGSYFRKEMCQ